MSIRARGSALLFGSAVRIPPWLNVVLDPSRECVSDVYVPAFQAPDSTARPPSTASAPAGPGAPPVTWYRDPAQRCSTAFVTTRPVSATPSAPASRNNGLKTRSAEGGSRGKCVCPPWAGGSSQSGSCFLAALVGKVAAAAHIVASTARPVCIC